MTARIKVGDCREVLVGMATESVHCVVTSPPYWGLRDYNLPPLVWGAWRGSLGLEPTPELYVEHIVEVFREVRRVLRKDGTVWLNMGDCYAGGPNGRPAADTKAAGRDDRTFRDKPFGTVGGPLKAKDLVEMPSEVVRALRADGWWLRARLPWVKPNGMPDSVKDRPGANSVEYVFLLSRSARYFYDAEAVRAAGGSYTKMPDGWDTGPGSHGRIHRQGREKGRKRAVPPRHSAYPSSARTTLDTVGRGAGRGFRNCDLFYSSINGGLISDSDGTPLALDVATAPYPDAHFATFPPKLVEPCILAGTSAKGCCPECGAPWVREVEAVYRGGNRIDRTLEKGATRNRLGGQKEWDAYVPAQTTGWRPSCECREDTGGTGPWQPRHCTVLDPFGGAGTVGLVAERLGRDSILIELSEDYADMARARIRADLGRVESTQPETHDPGPLFPEVAP